MSFIAFIPQISGIKDLKCLRLDSYCEDTGWCILGCNERQLSLGPRANGSERPGDLGDAELLKDEYDLGTWIWAVSKIAFVGKSSHVYRSWRVWCIGRKSYGTLELAIVHSCHSWLRCRRLINTHNCFWKKGSLAGARKHTRAMLLPFPWKDAKKSTFPIFRIRNSNLHLQVVGFFQQNQTRSTPWIVFQQVLKKPSGLLPPNILISTCSPRKLPVRFRYHIKKQLVEIIFSYFTYKFTLQQNWQRKETGRSAFFSASFF